MLVCLVGRLAKAKAILSIVNLNLNFLHMLVISAAYLCILLLQLAPLAPQEPPSHTFKVTHVTIDQSMMCMNCRETISST